MTMSSTGMLLTSLRLSNRNARFIWISMGSGIQLNSAGGTHTHSYPSLTRQARGRHEGTQALLPMSPRFLDFGVRPVGNGPARIVRDILDVAACHGNESPFRDIDKRQCR